MNITTLTDKLGKVTVTTTEGFWHRTRGKKVELTLKLVTTIHKRDDGSIEWFNCHVRAYFKKKQWDEGKHGMLYTDMGVQRNVNTFLNGLGYPGIVDWSEHNMQELNYGDFDADSELAIHIHPELGKVKIED